MQETWKEQAREIAVTFSLEAKPVAITFTNDEVDIGQQTKKTWLCRALKLAAGKGSQFVIDRENSGCPGGSWHCGLSEPPSAQARRGLQEFLTRGEKLTHSIVTFQRMSDLGSSPPTGLSERIYVGPMDSAPIRPDIVVFVCNAEQACRLVTLDHYWDGKPIHAELTGSLCHAAISYPVVTGNTNLTLGDWTARRMQKYGPDVVFLTIPYERMENVVLAIPECSAGTAEVVIPEAFRQREDE
ncbi:MAG TPA: DUF169 domain-containing protein [Candidatus Anoxymicrobiaceae bacterium]|jgi:uncharacterized protein (DUF169 family)